MGVLPYAQCCWWKLEHGCSAEAITKERTREEVEEDYFCMQLYLRGATFVRKKKGGIPCQNVFKVLQHMLY